MSRCLCVHLSVPLQIALDCPYGGEIGSSRFREQLGAGGQ